MSATDEYIFAPLPVLTDLRETYASELRPALRRTLIVGVQHLLDSTGSLYEELIRCGVARENVVLLGKYYSTSPEVVTALRRTGVHVMDSEMPAPGERFAAALDRDIARLWTITAARVANEREIEHVILVDDGGRAIQGAARTFSRSVDVTAIEQTTSGLAQRATWPSVRVIEAAGSAVKRHVEPALIADAVIEKSRTVLRRLNPGGSCGIVGVGNIGRAVGRALAADGRRVLGYDIRPVVPPPGVKMVASLTDLLRGSEYVFGCTGVNALAGIEPHVSRIGGCKVFFSCSSEDVEFLALLALAEAFGDPLAEQTVQIGDATWRIARGGYPVNFDGSPTSVPTRQIQLTRALLMASVLQALWCKSPERASGSGEMLLPDFQMRVLRSWLSSGGQPSIGMEWPASDVPRWIEIESSGIRPDCPNDIPVEEPMIRTTTNLSAERASYKL